MSQMRSFRLENIHFHILTNLLLFELVVLGGFSMTHVLLQG
jgi:hypothetical protein